MEAEEALRAAALQEAARHGSAQPKSVLGKVLGARHGAVGELVNKTLPRREIRDILEGDGDHIASVTVLVEPTEALAPQLMAWRHHTRPAVRSHLQ